MTDASSSPRAQPFDDRTFAVQDGLQLHYRDHPGRGPVPLLCLHGLTRNGRDFTSFAQRLSPRFRVIVLDFRGRGLSQYDPQPARYTPLTYAKDVIELLDGLSVDRAIFVGTSLGGLVTLAVNAMASDRVAGAILNDVGPELSEAGLARIMTYVGKDTRFASWEEAAGAIAANNGRVPASFTDADWLAMTRNICRERDGMIVYDYDMAIAVPLAAAGAAPKVDLWPLFKALTAKPLLVVRGAQSDLLSSAAVQRMAEAAPSSQFIEMPGVGHAPTLSEPEAARAIDLFLERFDDSGQ
ncbi:MAG: alpha/beta hydrolase [Sphingomicrobium sp.]